MQNFDVEIDWIVNKYCNFNCAYCGNSADVRKRRGDSHTVQQIAEAFAATGLRFLIHITGGEPFLFPEFVALCRELSGNHLISINTNLSTGNVYDFADTVHPDRVASVHCSLHIEERERKKLVEDFIEKYTYLRERGFYVYASYVMYPHLFERYEEDFHYFKSKGILLNPKVFRGKYCRYRIPEFKMLRKLRSRFELEYPDKYSEKEKNIIRRYLDEIDADCDNAGKHDRRERVSIDLSLDKNVLDGLRSFKNRACYAGSTFVTMTPSGDLFRCHDDQEYLGNLFEKNVKLFSQAYPCKAELCHCHYFGYRYVVDA